MGKLTTVRQTKRGGKRWGNKQREIEWEMRERDKERGKEMGETDKEKGREEGKQTKRERGRNGRNRQTVIKGKRWGKQTDREREGEMGEQTNIQTKREGDR